MVASAVIRIGPQTLPGAVLDGVRHVHRGPVAGGRRYWLIRSMSTIALVTTMPTSISMPISEGRPSGTPRDQQQRDGAGGGKRDGDQQDQRLDQGLEGGHHDDVHDGDGRQHGQAQLAERIRLLGGGAADGRRSTPAGRLTESSRFCTSALSAPSLLPDGVTDTLAVRWPLEAVMDRGTSTCFTVAMLRQRHRTGRGRHRDVAAAASMLVELGALADLDLVVVGVDAHGAGRQGADGGGQDAGHLLFVQARGDRLGPVHADLHHGLGGGQVAGDLRCARGRRPWP